MNDLDKIKIRIKKLIALSKSPNENEAMAALEKARRLMEEYGLNEKDCVYISSCVKSTKRYIPWRTVIANSMAWLYNCYKFRDQNNGFFVFSGEEIDVFMAIEMYSYLIKTIERMAKQNIRKNAKSKFRESYKWGIASSLYNRIETLGQSCSWAHQREEKITAIEEYVSKKHDLIVPVHKKIKINNSALTRGFVDGGKISLNRQTTGHGGQYITDSGRR
jgi:hypothetical protein